MGVLVRVGDPGHQLSPFEARILDACQRPATRSELAKAAGRHGGAGSGSLREILGVVDGFISRGILVEIPEGLGAPARSSAHRASISTVVLLTCERPRLFRRCLESYASRLREYGHDNVRCLVVDDSRSPESALENQASVERLRKAGDARRIDYIGRSQRKAFARALAAETGASPALCRFLLLGWPDGPIPSIGAARNAALCETTGELVLSADDDTVCEHWELRAPGPRLRLSVAPHGDFEWCWREEGDKKPGSVDFLAVHGELLGKDPRQVLLAEVEAGRPIEIGKIRPQFLRRLRSRHSRIALTGGGVVGDSGVGSSLGYILLEGESGRRLLASEKTFREAILSHRVRSLYTRRTVAVGSVQGGNFGMCNQLPLPPFIPVGRGEDDLFGVTLRLVAEGALSGFLPLAVAHRPDRSRRASLSVLREKWLESDLSWALTELLSDLPPAKGSYEEEYARLGRSLGSLGSIPASELAELLSERQAAVFTRRIELLSSFLSAKEYPEYAAKVARAALRDAESRLRKPVSALPAEFGAFGKQAARRFQRYLSELGELYSSWPELRAGIVRLRKRGVGLSRNP